MFNRDYEITAIELHRQSRMYAKEFNQLLRKRISNYNLPDNYFISFMIGDANNTSNILNAVSRYMKSLCNYVHQFHTGYADDRDFVQNGIFNMDMLRRWFLENYVSLESNDVQNTTVRARREFVPNLLQSRINEIRTSPTELRIRFKIFCRSKYSGLELDVSNYSDMFKQLSQMLTIASMSDNQMTPEQFKELTPLTTPEDTNYYHRLRSDSFLLTAVRSTVGNLDVDNPLLFNTIFIEQAYKRCKDLQNLKKKSVFNYNYQLLGGLRAIKIYRGNNAILTFRSKRYASDFIDVLIGQKTPQLIQPENIAEKFLQPDTFPFMELNYTKTEIKQTSKRKIRMGINEQE